MAVEMKRSKSLLIGFILIALLFPGLEAEVYYPWQESYIGALESSAWAGLVFVPSIHSGFAFRIKVKKGGETADGLDLFFLVSEVGPHSPDGQYARMKLDMSLPFGKGRETPVLKKPPKKSDILVLEWSRQNEKTVVGKIEAPKNLEVQIVHYFPWNFGGTYRVLPDSQILGMSSSLEGRYYIFWASQEAASMNASQGDELVLSFPTESENKIYFIAGTGENARILRSQIYRYKNEKTIDSFLKEEEKRYNKQRVKVEGLYEGVARAITNNLYWMTLYQSGMHRLYTPAGRRWIFPQPGGGSDHWTIFEWDSFFNALELSVESTRHSRDVLRSVLECQYANGNIPNWRGRYSGAQDRSQPPVGGYVVLKYFLKTGDVEFLQYAYPYLKKWHSYWKAKKPNGQPRRDGNRDGLLEWGTDSELIPSFVPSWEEGVSGKTRAMWESGQDDLPNWDAASFDEKTGTLTMNCLDLSSLYALDAWCLAQMAKVLKIENDFGQYTAEYEQMKTLINEHLWDEKDGFYYDRHWNGQFSKKKAAANFFPLLARIPDMERAQRLRRRLLNDKEFWGDFVIPTISRDDPSFQDQQYWRGTIWPPTNYLVYQGLKVYGFDAAASEFAEKSARLFLLSWENFQLCPENFDSRTGEAGGQRYQSWGPLFALIALEEYLDFTPWEGFRFGMIKPDKGGKLSRIAIQGRHYDVEVSRSKLKLREEGREIIKANGPAVFRHFLYSENEVSFEMKSLEERAIRIKLLTEGKYQVEVDNQATRIFEGKSIKMKVPEGEHSVAILLLEKKD
jgi:neutral trehalase